MIFNKQFGKRFGRRKPTRPAKQSVSSESEVAETTIPYSLDNEDFEPISPEPEKQESLEGFTVLESYQLNGPYASVNILRDTVRGSIKYTIKEPSLTESDAEHLRRLKCILNEILELKQSELESKQAAGEYLVKKCNGIFNDYRFDIDVTTK